ncbi:hypothetical protein HDR67_03785 [bacterium]|nr:hypothetical protein [bacterium]
MIRVEDFYPLILEAFEKNKTFSFPVNGKSMQPLLHANDVVEIAAIDSVHVGDILLYRRENGQFVLHRVRKIEPNGYTFVGDHQALVEKNISASQLIGKVISYKKQGKDKQYLLKGIRYNLYKCLVRMKLFRRFCGKLL